MTFTFLFHLTTNTWNLCLNLYAAYNAFPNKFNPSAAFSSSYGIFLKGNHQSTDEVVSATSTHVEGIAFTNSSGKVILGLWPRVWDMSDYVIPSKVTKALDLRPYIMQMYLIVTTDFCVILVMTTVTTVSATINT